MIDLISTVIIAIFFFIIVVGLFGSIKMVPTKTAFVVERLGKYHSTLGPGFHALLPYLDKVPFKIDLKEETIEVPPLDCFSKDEVNVEVDGVIYISVVDAEKACYGVTNYRYAAVQLAQTTTRSVIGTLDLDRTFEEREQISARVVEVLERAGSSWGIRVHRYEIKNLKPPESVRVSMEKQVTAERDKRAILAQSQGDKEAKINLSEGIKTEMINRSQGEMHKQINEAQGRAEEIITVTKATAGSVSKLAQVVQMPGGHSALKLQVAEKFFNKMNALADPKTRVIIPANITEYDSWLAKIGLK